MICIHHNKDLDGHASGAIVKKRYPDCTLIGWDYGDPIPEFPENEELILIDISFPIDVLKELGTTRQITVIDHHISFKKEYDDRVDAWDRFLYVYKDRTAACEIGWNYLFPSQKVPPAITLLGRYDTWRQEEGSWEGETLPFQYFMRLVCNSAETFPERYIHGWVDLDDEIETGKMILKYQAQQDSIIAKMAFEREVFGLRGLCVNVGGFNSNTLKSRYDPEQHDILLAFVFSKDKWRISLRSDKPEVDVSVIAKQRGGGGHKSAAGYEVKNFDDIFK